MSESYPAPGFSSFWQQHYATRQCAWTTKMLSQRIGAVVAWGAWRGGLSANHITLAGLPITLAACIIYVTAGHDQTALAGLLLFQLAFGFDCADGQLARATGSASDFGGWLDVAVDFARNAAIGVSLLMFLLDKFEHPYLVACAVYLFCAGELITLHTVTYVNRGDHPAHGLTGTSNRIREILLFFKDTPVVLLCISLLWWWPTGLVVYIAGLGLVDILVATVQARIRLMQK